LSKAALWSDSNRSDEFMAANVINCKGYIIINKIDIIHVVVLYVGTYICPMKLNEAIKQKNFKTEMHKAVVNILYTNSWLNNKQAAVFRECDLTMKQFNILRILKGQYPEAATVNLLIERMIDKSSNASRIVDKLVEKGYVERKICPEDRRRVDVIISNNGMDVVEETTRQLEKLEIFSDALSEKEAIELNNLLDKLRTKE